MDGSNKDNDATERLRCFICDIEVQDCSYVLATCRMQNSRSRVIKKLGELVGEGYMVVISEDDVICRNCGSLFSKLDRLESEMYETRDRILHFLEQKYSLKDGELRCKDKPKLCQPPQITKSSVKSNENGSSSGNKKILEKSHLWMRCNKCKYTTRLDSFTMRHLRDAQRTFCDNCGLIYNSESQQNKKHVCDKANNVRNQENETDNFNVVIKNNTIETISLNQAQPNLPITQIPVMTPAPPFLANSNYLYFSNISSASDAISSQQLMYMPQPVNTIVSPNKITEADSNSMQKMKVKEDRSEDRKQMLTLKNDGNFEMVDIVIKKDEKETLNVDPIMFQKL